MAGRPDPVSDEGIKKPVWNNKPKPHAESWPALSESWPALSESTRSSPKTASSDATKTLSDNSLLLPHLGAGIVPPTHSPEIMNNGHSTLAPPNNVLPTRQKSMKSAGGGGNGSSSGYTNTVNGGFNQPPPSQKSPSADVQLNASGKSGPVVTEHQSPKDRINKESGQRGLGSQSRTGNDHTQRSNSFKKGNGGTHPRGDGSQHHSFGGRGNQDRGEWSSQRSFNGRDSHLQPQMISPRGFLPTTHAPTPFVHPAPVAIQPYPMVYPDVPPQLVFYAASPESFRGVPLVAPMSPHGMFYAGPDPQLIARIVHQVDYYFSNENLVRDTYLRKNMDDQGWVPVQLIASFKKMSILTENIQLILDAVRASSVVEAQGDKIRRREDWSKWIMPTVQSPSVSSPQAQWSSIHEMLAASAQSLSLEDKPSYQGQVEASLGRFSSGDSSQSQSPGQAAFEGLDQTNSVRSPNE